MANKTINIGSFNLNSNLAKAKAASTVVTTVIIVLQIPTINVFKKYCKNSDDLPELPIKIILKFSKVGFGAKK